MKECARSRRAGSLWHEDGEISVILYVDEGTSHADRDIPHVMVGMRLVCANMRPFAPQLCGYLFGARHPAIVLERYPLPIRDHIIAKRAVEPGLPPCGDAALAVAAAAVPQVAKQLLVFVMIKFVLVTFVTGRFADRYAFKH